jgi:N-acetylglucosaminyl-diphospho-decaprenol L-rhamnosyltransferase
MDLSIIIVNWNVKGLLHQCLQTLTDWQAQPAHGDTHYEAEIIVVDSASNDGSVEMVQQAFPRVKLIASDENLGYAAGNNIGAAQASGRYLLILNPDTQIIGDAPTQMLDYLDSHPQVGAVGPQLRYADGSPQSSRRRFPTLVTAFCESTLLHQWFPNNPSAQRYHMTDQSTDQTQPVDWVVGAAFMIRRTVWDQVGPFDEAYFMYFEELDWCRRCRQEGWEILYLPTAVVMHHEGKSSEQVVAERTIRFQRSKIRYFAKYHGGAAAALLRGFLLCTFGVQMVEESLKYLLGHKRPLRQQRISVYSQVLRSGLAPTKAQNKKEVR